MTFVYDKNEDDRLLCNFMDRKSYRALQVRPSGCDLDHLVRADLLTAISAALILPELHQGRGPALSGGLTSAAPAPASVPAPGPRPGHLGGSGAKTRLRPGRGPARAASGTPGTCLPRPHRGHAPRRPGGRMRTETPGWRWESAKVKGRHPDRALG